MKLTARSLELQIAQAGDPERAHNLARFFKTGPGQYGEGDQFYGVKVPQTRAIIKDFYGLELSQIKKALQSSRHEVRLAACLILVHQYGRADKKERKLIGDFYLANTKYINNWDLVDLSACYIVGPEQAGTNFSGLKELADSELIWDRRIAILACFWFIKLGHEEPAFSIAEILLNDDHDLINKAVGWMLREVGKRVSREAEEAWLLENNRYKTMPRTTLRYAIEHFDEARRQQYLKSQA